ncbi:hypothetical protein COU15_01165 [Candidatus Kaiserbacteria bacterium CG10_big_fil_rev_8_21_14_0_10_45_20]|uniref:YdhG-like domain-containing protein n=1 Tax=Candidatus Kaiserbacteria bacterium CG10_big_fil_rev_8_21_14_0_10_45_20 TaxID=1974607 RepID=A0A2H0UG06_9BACT|nr:MAG: hypothetical protein COU15_01165 [Candidatus Kaiserbacteria bacterium CG10_big_fil_rev_8_21_14_0_10_45_20]
MVDAKLKTKKNKNSVKDFIANVSDEQKKKDAEVLLRLFTESTGERGVMWGDSIIGFGTYHYVYNSGREGDWLMVGFSPRKQNLSIYCMSGFKDYASLFKKLGPHKTSVSCLYIKRLSDIHIPTLKTLIKKSYTATKKQYSK